MAIMCIRKFLSPGAWFMRSLIKTFVMVIVVAVATPVQAQTNQGGTTGGGNAGGNAGGGQGQGGGQATTGNFGPTGGLSFGGPIGSNVQGGAGAAGAASIPTAPNPFRVYYANPLGIGLSGATTTNLSPKAAFGQPLFGAIAAANAVANIQQAIAGGAGFATVGLRKAPSYVTTLSDDIPLIRHLPSQLERDLQDVLRRSTTLKGKEGIAVSVSGQVAILRGQVPSERELRLAESLIRLTPGVRDVQNELTVGP